MPNKNFFLAVAVLLARAAGAEESAQELAKKLSNPVAAMISLPLQFNYDGQIGPERDGSKSALNIQPVAPFSISDTWNVISRTILPIVNQSDLFPGSGHQTGIGDITQRCFFRPRSPRATG
jgi:hypothetical protein